jgi:hypothetical protein
VEDTTLLEDEVGKGLEEEELEMSVGAEDNVVVLADVVATAVLMHEQPLEIFDGKLEQAEAQVGNATEVVARV